MIDFVNIFKDYLKKRGLRLTPERLQILDQVFAYDDHFQTDELLVRMRQNGYEVSKATIYRTLPLLVKCGLLTEVVDAQKRSQYEHVHELKQHAHLICILCSKIDEFKNEEIDALQRSVCEKHEFEPVKFRNEILGYCAHCKNHKNSQ